MKLMMLGLVSLGLAVAACSTTDTPATNPEVVKAEVALLKQQYLDTVFMPCIRDGMLQGQNVSDEDAKRIVSRIRAEAGDEFDDALDKAARDLQKHSEEDRQKILAGERAECTQESAVFGAKEEIKYEKMMNELKRRLGRLGR